jgi:hypothetical protein
VSGCFFECSPGDVVPALQSCAGGLDGVLSRLAMCWWLACLGAGLGLLLESCHVGKGWSLCVFWSACSSAQSQGPVVQGPCNTWLQDGTGAIGRRGGVRACDCVPVTGKPCSDGARAWLTFHLFLQHLALLVYYSLQGMWSPCCAAAKCHSTLILGWVVGFGLTYRQPSPAFGIVHGRVLLWLPAPLRTISGALTRRQF